ncbi:hypothetical protein [Desulfosudis oleivorans]|uniref:Conserved hypothetical membrane protein n=1 Tax=Desulfosudis oleivorans (strain DSM 6200 / JCM 39069 / Hxd3) TaxID=96561 RepID=A8ZVB4_DESOH|nr:hypothetical protein [Desulfosudis oleivorans]ABW66575.1 conserved hypothetical membrane protein [Desulfosudis oleivorans Hxd3]
MLKKLTQALQSMAGQRLHTFDPSSLGDPVALQTGWTPARSGGASFRTHKLVAVNPDRLEFRPAGGAMLFYLIFLLAGLGILIGFSAQKISSGGLAFDLDTILPIAVGAVFAAVGGGLLYFGTLPVVFDRRNGFFWKGRTAPHEVMNRRALKHFAGLKEIHALQLISEHCTGNKSSYYSYELNLVLKDGRRINVVDHGSRDKLREDAKTLSEFLQKPVWDTL